MSGLTQPISYSMGRKFFLFTVSLPTHTLSTSYCPAVGRLASYTSNICRSQPLVGHNGAVIG